MKSFHEDHASFCTRDWYQILTDKVQEVLVYRKSEMHRMVFVNPMSRADTYAINAVGISDTVIQLFQTDDGDFVIFQPAMPQEVTSYQTEPPIKTRPLNTDDDLGVLAEAIALFAAKDFVKWQGIALIESQRAAEWRCQSTAFAASLLKEPWTPDVSVSDDGSIKAAFGSVVAKITMDKLTLTFHGKSAERLEVVRGALRDEHRRWEPRKSEGEDIDPVDED